MEHAADPTRPMPQMCHRASAQDGPRRSLFRPSVCDDLRNCCEPRRARADDLRIQNEQAKIPLEMRMSTCCCLLLYWPYLLLYWQQERHSPILVRTSDARNTGRGDRI